MNFKGLRGVQMKKKPDENLNKILDFVNSEVTEKGYPPSVREICSAVGFKSTSTVHGYLQRLQENGMIQKDPTKPRALRVISRNSNPLQKPKAPLNNMSSRKSYYVEKELIDVPLVGKVTAGQPILAVENIEDTYPLPAELIKASNVFMLRVKGDSMIEAGILNNDLVLVKQQPTAENGDIVVALIEDEATIKTFYKEKEYIRLQPQNRYMSPILVKNDISILGKIIGVFRLM